MIYKPISRYHDCTISYLVYTFFYFIGYIKGNFSQKLMKNTIIYIFALYKKYGNCRNVKLLKISSHYFIWLISVSCLNKQLVENMLYEIILFSWYSYIQWSFFGSQIFQLYYSVVCVVLFINIDKKIFKHTAYL